ncbi:Armadillo repeat-containing protein 7, variant 2 [Chamberlinius hualienensis]
MALRKDSDRSSYLQQLVTEFQDTNSDDVRLQVLANLANFSYDPTNFETLRRLGIIELFLDQLDSDDDELTEFAMGGLCNLSPDPHFKTGIIRRNGLQPIIKCLSSTNEETVLSAITALMSLIDYESVHGQKTLVYFTTHY